MEATNKHSEGLEDVVSTIVIIQIVKYHETSNLLTIQYQPEFQTTRYS